VAEILSEQPNEAGSPGSEMPWPFSRSEPESTATMPATATAPAAAKTGRRTALATRRRLIGAAALLLAAVIVLPMLLDTAPRPVREDISITIASPPPPPASQPRRRCRSTRRSPSPRPRAASRRRPIRRGVARPSPCRPLQRRRSRLRSRAAVDRGPSAGCAASASEKFAVQWPPVHPGGGEGPGARLKKDGFSATSKRVDCRQHAAPGARRPFASREEASARGEDEGRRPQGDRGRWLKG